MNVISLESFAGNGDIPEGTLRSLVTRTATEDALAELAKPLGYTEGPRLGVTVRLDHETGNIGGSVFQLFGEDRAVVYKTRTPARTLWDVDRKLDIAIEIRVRTIYLK